LAGEQLQKAVERLSSLAGEQLQLQKAVELIS